MSIEINGKEYRTPLEWEKKHRTVKQTKTAQEMVVRRRGHPASCVGYNYYYPIEATKPWTKKQFEQKKRADALERQKKRQEQHDKEIAEEADRFARTETMLWAMDAWYADDDIDVDFIEAPHTAWQWVEHGFVPRPDAKWTHSGPAQDYYYAEWYDVRYDPERAASLQETGPREVDRLPDGRPYDGRPWWD